MSKQITVKTKMKTPKKRERESNMALCPHCRRRVRVTLEYMSDGETMWAKIAGLEKP